MTEVTKEQKRAHIQACVDVGYVVFPADEKLSEESTDSYYFQSGKVYKFGGHVSETYESFTILGGFGHNDGYDQTELDDFSDSDIMKFQPISGDVLEKYRKFDQSVAALHADAKKLNELAKELGIDREVLILSEASELSVWRSSRC